MVVFLYGSDSYRLKQAREEIVNRYKAKYKSGMNLFCFDFSEASDMAPVRDVVKSASFFNEHKLIVCKNVFSRKTTAETMAEFIKDYNPAADSDITLIVADGLSEKDLVLCHKDLFKTLSDKNNIVRIIGRLEGQKLSEWIQKEFQIRDCSIRSNTARKLADLTGNDSWALVNEIEKLAAYGKNGEVTAGDIDLLVYSRTDLNIFDLIDAIGARNQAKATELLYQELKTGRDPYYILTMIIYQFRNLLSAKDLKERGLSESEISKKTRLHPFVVKKALRSPFNQEGCFKIYRILTVVDNSFKIGQSRLEDSLYNLLFSF